jgi:hypothetical protein
MSVTDKVMMSAMPTLRNRNGAGLPVQPRLRSQQTVFADITRGLAFCSRPLLSSYTESPNAQAGLRSLIRAHAISTSRLLL